MAKNINVLMFTPYPPACGGIATWSKMVVEYSQTFDNVKIFPVNIGSLKVKSVDRSKIQRVIYGLLDLKDVLKQAKKIIKNNKIDVIHIILVGGLSVYRDKKLIKLAKKHNIPVVTHIRFGRIPEIMEKQTREWKSVKKNLDIADKIMTIDEATQKALLPLYESKLEKIYNPVIIDKNVLKMEHQNNRRILFVGWVIKTKGIEELLEAWNYIVTKYTDVKLDVVGPCNDEYVNDLKSRFNTTNVTFHNQIPHEEVVEMMTTSEIFILPSYTEGCPNVVLEAMGYRIPVIASSVGAIPELLEDDCGCLIPPQDAKKVEEALEFLLNDKQMQMKYIENAYNKINNDFVIEKVFARYMENWNGILTNNESTNK